MIMTNEIGIGDSVDHDGDGDKEILKKDQDTNADGDAAEADKEKEEIESSPDITFSPPLYRQRYTIVSTLIEEIIISGNHGLTPKTIVEYGSAQCKLMMYLKNMPFVERIAFVDLDRDVLEEATFNLKPLPYEFLVKRDSPLVVEQYAGCVTKWDSKFIDMEPEIFAVVAIELIEHLDPHILSGFEKNIFGMVSPPVVVVTTPNSDFNILFHLKPGQFRHWDHRFEWSRSEFETWCNKICEMYQYDCKIDGVGHGPAGTEEFGSPSQYAIFKRSNIWRGQSHSNREEKYPGIVCQDAYKLVSRIDYPFYSDPRTVPEKIADEYKYYVNNSLFSLSKLQDFWINDITTTTVSLKGFFEDIQYKLNKPTRHVPIVLNDDQIFDALKSAGHEIEVSNDVESGIKNYTVLISIPSEVEYLGEPEFETEEEVEEEENGTPNMNEMVSDIRLTIITEDDEEW